MNKIYLFIVLFFFPFFLFAQQTKNNHTFFISPAFESLYSTHGNFFYSQSLLLSKKLTNKIEVAGGIERAYTPIHHDNDFVLYQLHFLPVYGNLKYHFKNTGKWFPFVESSIGISFNKYKIATDLNPTKTWNVTETGLFINIGSGLRYLIADKFFLFSSVGFKGYKMSFNEYDINPHGITYGVGFGLKIN